MLFNILKEVKYNKRVYIDKNEVKDQSHNKFLKKASILNKIIITISLTSVHFLI